MGLDYKDGWIVIPQGIEKESVHSPNFIAMKIRGTEFIFDSITAEKFKNEFDTQGEAFVDENTYLIRKNSKGRKESFHRWLMQLEIAEFTKAHNLSESEVEVHHKNLNHRDNRKDNLECKRKEEHKDLHREERAWVRYRKKMGGLWSSEDEEKKRLAHEHHWKMTH